MGAATSGAYFWCEPGDGPTSKMEEVVRTRSSAIAVLALAIAAAAMLSQSAQAGGWRDGFRPEPVVNGGNSVGIG
jgi:hypothetical protein